MCAIPGCQAPQQRGATHGRGGADPLTRRMQGVAPFPWEEEQTEMALCGNTCAAASNGVCDEGRLDSYAAVRVCRPHLCASTRSIST